MHWCIEYGGPQFPADSLLFRVRSTKISKNNNAEDRADWELAGCTQQGCQGSVASSGTFT